MLRVGGAITNKSTNTKDEIIMIRQRSAEMEKNEIQTSKLTSCAFIPAHTPLLTTGNIN